MMGSAVVVAAAACGGGDGDGVSVEALGSAMVVAAVVLAQRQGRQQRGCGGHLGSAAMATTVW